METRQGHDAASGLARAGRRCLLFLPRRIARSLRTAPIERLLLIRVAFRDAASGGFVSIAATFEIEYLQYLDADGKLVRDDLPAFARDIKQLVELYKLMLYVRVFDAKAVALQRTGKLGTYASCLGHEAAHVAIGSAMQEDDVFAPMYREYGAQFYRGVKPREVLLYWGGARRGSDFSGPAHDFAWCVPIATQALHGAGAALAFKVRKEPRVAVTVIGDGSSSKGDFYGAINVAGAMKLPLVVVIVNN